MAMLGHTYNKLLIKGIYNCEIDIHFLFTQLMKVVIISMLCMIMIIKFMYSLSTHFIFYYF